MNLDTYRKAFIAKAAAQIMTEMVGQEIAKAHIDPLSKYMNNSSAYDQLSDEAVTAACMLTDKLEEKWAYGTNTFFDPEDSVTSNIERRLDDISTALNDIKELKQRLLSLFTEAEAAAEAAEEV